jgi:hypothetical protein
MDLEPQFFFGGDIMTFYGADVSQLRDLAKAADKAATLLSSRASSLQSQIQSAPWKGADGARFRQDWTASHRPSLERVVSSLRENSRILLQHADEQEKSSASSTGSSTSFWDKITSLANQASAWAQERALEAAQAAAHHKELEQSLDTMVDASPEEQAKWWEGLSEEDRKYLIEGTGEDGGKLALELMKMDGGIPLSAQELAKHQLQDVARADIAVYTETGTASIEAQIAWAHGNAQVGTEVVKNADGSATMKVHGNLGLGVNDTSGTVGATLSGEVSREYEFASLEEAMAARDQLYRDLPPNEVGEIRDVAGNAPLYVLKSINEAAEDNGSTEVTTKAKGTLSLAADGDSGVASGSAKLDLAYEKNLTEGTSTASGEVSAEGKLNLDGRIFEASGKGGLEVNMAKDNSIESVSVSMEGTVAEGASAEAGAKPAKIESSVSVGTQGTVKIDVDYSPENKDVIDSYLRHVAMGDSSAAAVDAAKLYEAGSATVQVNTVVTSSTEGGIDAKLGKVEVKTENQATTNVSTYYKVPNDAKLERL